MNLINDINIAAKLLQDGLVIAIPTETVYGLAAIYDNQKAVEKIFHTKNRPLDHPLIMHTHSISTLKDYGLNIPDYAYQLASTFSPGPLTFVIQKQSHVPDYVTGGQETVAIRIPAHDKTLALLKTLNKPLVAPSANPYCQISPTNASHVYRYFGESIPILDGGPCDIGIESTIILATDPNKITVLRPGSLSVDEISSVAGVPCEMPAHHKIKTPGNKAVHYAPKTPFYMTDDLSELQDIACSCNEKLCFVLMHDIPVSAHYKIIMPNDPKAFTQKFYDLLHQIDNQFDAIFIQTPPSHPCWIGVRDRLTRASQPIHKYHTKLV